jgi:hypothetical protein
MPTSEARIARGTAGARSSASLRPRTIQPSQLERITSAGALALQDRRRSAAADVDPRCSAPTVADSRRRSLPGRHLGVRGVAMDRRRRPDHSQRKVACCRIMSVQHSNPATTANERNCYCDNLDAGFRRERGIPDGFCGICERCRKPGHTRHSPASVPYTGSWCDRCYRVVKMTSYLTRPGFW